MGALAIEDRSSQREPKVPSGSLEARGRLRPSRGPRCFMRWIATSGPVLHPVPAHLAARRKQIAELACGQPLETVVAKKKRRQISPVFLEAQLAITVAARSLDMGRARGARPGVGDSSSSMLVASRVSSCLSKVASAGEIDSPSNSIVTSATYANPTGFHTTASAIRWISNSSPGADQGSPR